MKSNIPKHPCKNKCTDFKEEQCKTCLIPSNSTELESPESDFLIGDVVVLINGDDDSLYEFSKVNTVLDAKCYIAKPRKAKMLCVWIREIRPASIIELSANRRLTEAEQALAEVS